MRYPLVLAAAKCSKHVYLFLSLSCWLSLKCCVLMLGTVALQEFIYATRFSKTELQLLGKSFGVQFGFQAQRLTSYFSLVSVLLCCCDNLGRDLSLFVGIIETCFPRGIALLFVLFVY